MSTKNCTFSINNFAPALPFLAWFFKKGTKPHALSYPKYFSLLKSFTSPHFKMFESKLPLSVLQFNIFPSIIDFSICLMFKFLAFVTSLYKKSLIFLQKS